MLKRLKNFLTIPNLVLALLIGVFLFFKGPTLIHLWKLQGEEAQLDLPKVDFLGNPVESEFPLALIFWATWCPPCEFELKRVQEMIDSKEIDPKKILAVSVDQNFEDVRRIAQERGYTFPIHWDQDQSLSRKFNVVGTPTILLIDQDGKISWATTGISPTLSLRLKSLNQ